MDSPIVTVLMPVYNGEAFVDKAIESILSQTYKNFEFIIINDGSCDGTERIVKSYNDKRIVYIANESNLGLTANLNIGINLARGKYIARQDHDDISSPDRFKKQIDYLELYPNVALVGSCAHFIDQNGNIFSRWNVPTDYQKIKKRLEDTNAFCHGSVVFRKEIIQRVGGYREKAKYTEDYDLWLRFSEQYELANIGLPLYYLRRSIASTTTKNLLAQTQYHLLTRELSRERKKYGHDSLEELDLKDVSRVLINKYGLTKKTINEFQTEYISQYYTYAVQMKKHRDTLRYWWMIFRLDPQPWRIRALIEHSML